MGSTLLFDRFGFFFRRTRGYDTQLFGGGVRDARNFRGVGQDLRKLEKRPPQIMEISLKNLNSLFSETLLLAEEAEVTGDMNTFIEFIRENIPMEYLDYLENETNASLEDIWSENYQVQEQEIDDGCCLICEREMHLTRHHLIPRELHHQVMKKKGYPPEFLNKTISICRMCHSTVHRFYTNRELADTYNTLEMLMSQEKMLKYAHWASSQAGRGNRRTR
jgi:hypothetical protein